MRHMNSVRLPATIIFTALLIVIMVSSSRTTYTLSPAPDVTAIAACAQPPVRARAEPPACPWPNASWIRRAHHWPPAAQRDSAGHSGAPDADAPVASMPAAE